MISKLRENKKRWSNQIKIKTKNKIQSMKLSAIKTSCSTLFQEIKLVRKKHRKNYPRKFKKLNRKNLVKNVAKKHKQIKIKWKVNIKHFRAFKISFSNS